MRHLPRTVLLALVVAFAVWAAAASGQGKRDKARAAEPVKQRLLITPYSYPQPGEWALMCERIAERRADAAIIVLNPKSGALGQLTDDERELFAGGMQDCRNHGHRVIGYVTTGQKNPELRGGRRRLTSVKANVNRYYSMFPGIDGIFFDEMAKHGERVGSRAAAAGEVTNAKYYKRAYEYVKVKPGRGIVIGNMGLAPDDDDERPDWAFREENQSFRNATRLVDVLVVFEGPTELRGAETPAKVQPYDTFTPPDWTKHYPAKRFANLVYRAASQGDEGSDLPTITETCELAATRRAGRVYVTSDNLFLPAEKNPWNSPPEDEMLECPTLRRTPAAR